MESLGKPKGLFSEKLHANAKQHAIEVDELTRKSVDELLNVYKKQLEAELSTTLRAIGKKMMIGCGAIASLFLVIGLLGGWFGKGLSNDSQSYSKQWKVMESSNGKVYLMSERLGTPIVARDGTMAVEIQ